MSPLRTSLRNWSVIGFVALAAFIFLFKSHAVDSSNICLAMVVRNDEKTIERCLDSASGIVDCIAICDVGSEDRTVEIIEEYLKRNKIPGKVYRHQWKDIGYNRTLSFQAAQKVLQDQGVALRDSHVLFLDSDMVLQVSSEFEKDSLSQHAYAIEQKDQSHANYNLRLVSASESWRCVGVAQEYWTCGPEKQEKRLDTLKVDDLEDGENRKGRYERDIVLLRGELDKDPANARNVLYLAHSLKAVNEYDEAIKWCLQRSQMGGNKEEVWYSKLMLGECYEAEGQWDQAMQSYIDAYEYLPDRAEPLQKISTYFRNQGQNDLAYLYASQGVQIPYPKQHSLYIAFPTYEYQLDEDIAVAAYYTPYKDEGFAALNRLMLKKNIPQYLAEQCHRNLQHYVHNLEGAHFVPIEIELPHVREGSSIRYNPLNPSIIKTEGGYEVICRTVNYVQIWAKIFITLDVTDHLKTMKTRNFLVRYDRDLKKLSQQEITEIAPCPQFKMRNIEGLEDCRMFKFKGSTWFLCTTLDTNPTGSTQISLCKLSDDWSHATIPVQKLIPLPGPNPWRCEKNWLPFIKDGELLLIYSYDPYLIFIPDIDVGDNLSCQRRVLRMENQRHDFSRFCGSAGPVEFDGGYLMLVHEAIFDETQRNYTHRFVYLDKNLDFQKVSKPFTFVHKGIEFCCGMTIDHESKNLIMSIGIEDREASLCIVSLDTVQSMLEPLP